MGNYTILLIDYEPRSIERIREPLTAAGYVVEIATDGLSGIEAFHRLSPDLVLVEAMIPKKHGFEVCQELKRTPLGRRTPVLITTGVYKGRKYRTQALHIYGCDEYLEKPITPEQLLEIVGRFLGSGASAPPPRAAEPPLVPPEDSDPSARGKGGEFAKSALPAEPPALGSQRTKPTSIPETVAEDDTEDEIMARLDAILPSGGGATPLLSKPQTVAVVATIEQDPIAQMRAELDAELGSLSAALAFEAAPMAEQMPELIPSDQMVSPSILEALPVPEAEIPIAPLHTATPVTTNERPGQVVSLDIKRPRKDSKTERQSKGRSPEAAIPLAIDPPIPVSEGTLPSGTLVEPELESTAGRRGLPAMVWAAVGVVAIVAFYFVFSFSRGVSNGADDAPLPAPTTTTVASTPPVASAPSETRSRVPEPSRTVTDRSKFVLNALKVPVPKKTSERVSTPSSALTVARRPVAAGSAPTPSVAPHMYPEPAKSEPTAIEAANETQSEATPPSGLDDIVAGVETVPEPATVAPATTIAPGTLIPIDLADTMPVTLSRGVPAYSMQARELRLSGTVVMNVLVNEHGAVDQVVLVTGIPDADVNDTAMRAAMSWTYRPATKQGVPVKVWKSEQIVFKL